MVLNCTLSASLFVNWRRDVHCLQNVCYFYVFSYLLWGYPWSISITLWFAWHVVFKFWAHLVIKKPLSCNCSHVVTMVNFDCRVVAMDDYATNHLEAEIVIAKRTHEQVAIVIIIVILIAAVLLSSVWLKQTARCAWTSTPIRRATNN